MISALLVGMVAATPIQSTTVDLYRGSKVNGQGYWAVADTFLDSSDADRPKGGLFTLEGGKGRTILIKFGDLERAIPNGAKISKATLYLSPSSSDKPEFAWAGVVQAPWGEGPSTGRVPITTPIKGAATWKQSRSGSNDWQQIGATGVNDAIPIGGVAMEVQNNEIALTGLGSTIQTFRDRWFDNNGIALYFNGKSEFYSAQAKAGKPRLVVEYTAETKPAGPDLSVQYLTRSGSGAEASYQAIVKNVGSAAANAFSAQWITNEKAGGKFQVTKSLAPGEETAITLGKGYRANNLDHRAQKLALRVYPEGAEPNSNNDCLEIYEDAIPVFLNGAKIDADAVQADFRRFNEIYLAESKFSYAPEGSLERVRLVPARDTAEIVVDIAGNNGELGLLRKLVTALTGLASIEPDQKYTVEGREIPVSDPFSGLTGFGDTRNESLVLSGIPMPSLPVASLLIDNLPIEPTDLLNGTEVAAINLALNKKGNARTGILFGMPSTIILRATDLTGKPLDGAELSFFQVDGLTVPDAPFKTILTQDKGTVILESRDISSGSNGGLHDLKRNLFGNLKPDGTNGTILVKAQINGEIEWSWVKAWQLADFYRRGNKDAAIIDVRFNSPSGVIDRTANLAKGKLASDIAQSLPAQLSALVDDDLATETTLGGNIGDWVEIDLGRDRPIGEVQILLKEGGMPAKFDILAYATGQNPPQFDSWIKDFNSVWTKQNRGRKEGNSTLIPYRGPMTRSRFIRIVNKSGGAAKIAEVRVFALQAQ